MSVRRQCGLLGVSRSGWYYAPRGESAANEALMKRIKQMRCQYIRLDQAGVTFFFAGSETDYSGMINDMGGFNTMINGIMDSLADIADAVPASEAAK